MSPNGEPASAASATRPDVDGMTRALADFLRAAGFEEEAAGDAPERTAKAWAEHLFVGYRQDPVATLRPAWSDRGGRLVSVTGISFVSVCAHHLLPFFGRAHVVYLPDGRLTGLSRIEEMVYALSRRLQLQERLGDEIAATLLRGVDARGAACVLEAEHLCVFARGRRQRGTVTRTLAFAGEFEDDPAWQDRCLAWLAPALAAPSMGGPSERVETIDNTPSP